MTCERAVIQPDERKRPPNQAALHAEAMAHLAQHREGNVGVAAVGKVLVQQTNGYQHHRGYGGTFEHDAVIVRLRR